MGDQTHLALTQTQDMVCERQGVVEALLGNDMRALDEVNHGRKHRRRVGPLHLHGQRLRDGHGWMGEPLQLHFEGAPLRIPAWPPTFRPSGCWPTRPEAAGGSCGRPWVDARPRTVRPGGRWREGERLRRRVGTVLFPVPGVLGLSFWGLAQYAVVPARTSVLLGGRPARVGHPRSLAPVAAAGERASEGHPRSTAPLSLHALDRPGQAG